MGKIKLNISDKISLVTEEERKQIKMYAKMIDGKLIPDAEALRFLFAMFNKYIYPIDNSCGKCRQHVRDFWIQNSKTW